MPSVENELIVPVAGTTADTQSSYAGVERRRPGRAENVNPELVHLLRQEPRPDLFADSADALRAPTGIAVSVGISLVIWAGLYVGFRAIFG